MTPLPWDSAALSPQNVASLRQVALWGRGSIQSQLSLDGGKKLLVSTSLGLYLYESGSLSLLQFLPGARYLTHSPDQRWLAYAQQNDHQIGVLEINSAKKYKLLDTIVEAPKSVPDVIQSMEDKMPGISAQWLRELFNITAAAFSPDGSRLAVAFNDVEIGVWKVEGGSLEQKLARDRTSWFDETPTDQMAFSPDNSLLLTHERAGHFILWQVNESKLMWYLKYQNQYLSEEPFTPDGKYFITAYTAFGSANNSVVYLRDLRYGGTILSVPGIVSRGSASPDGKMLAVRQYQTVKLYSLGDYPAPLRPLVTGIDVQSAVFSSDSSQVIVNDGEQSWNVKDYKQISGMPAPQPSLLDRSQALNLGHLDAIDGLALGRQNEPLVWGHQNNQAYVWNAAGGQVKSSTFSASRLLNNLEYNPDPEMLAACTDAGMEVIDVVQNKSQVYSRCTDAGVLALAPDGVTFGRASMGNIELFDLTAGKVTGTLIEPQDRLIDLRFSADGKYLMGYTRKTLPAALSKFSVWQVDPPHTFKFNAKLVPDQVQVLAVSPDGQWLAMSSDKLRLWRMADAEQMKIQEVSGILSLAYSPDGSLLATGDFAGNIIVWSMPELKQLASFQASSLAGLGGLEGPDGTPLAANEQLSATQTQPGAVIGLTFTSNGANLVSAGADGTVRLWGIR